MNKIRYLLLLFIVIILVILFLRERQKTKRTFRKLENMLRQIKMETFLENSFDESVLSSLESEFYQYLKASNRNIERIEQERSTIKQLVSDISHQTKTPLSNILLYTELLGELELSNQAREYTEAIAKQGENLEFLTRSLVDLSRLETGIISFQVAPSNIKELLDKVVETALPLALSKKITMQYDEWLGYARFDMKWTAESVFNILENAIKYSPEETSILITTTEYESFVAIHIADQGFGVSEEDSAKIFTRFYRSSAVSEKPGAGIGLFLAREIISQQGGYIRLQQNQPQGSVFSIFFRK